MLHALNYAADGFAVFPVYEPQIIMAGLVPVCSCGKLDCRGKHPRTINGVKDASVDPEQIKRWWEKWPNASIGIATGKVSRLAVVDLDGPEGIASGNRLRLFSTITSITGKGAQLFFADCEGTTRNSVKKLAEGLDMRGENGYVVVPPSLHPNGRRYAWLGQPLSRRALSALPPRLITEPVSACTLRKSEGWIADALKGMKHGNIDNTLTSILGRLRYNNYSVDDAIVLLLPHARAAGATPGHLEEKAKHIWASYAAAPQIGQNSKTESIDVFLKDIKKVDWICEPFIAKKSLGFVVGLPETLKTWLMIDLAVESARDCGSWLGTFGVTSSRVLFIDQERFKGETQRRFSAVIAAKGLQNSDLKDRLFLKCGTTTRLDLEDSFRSFRTELLHLRPDLVIVDSFATFHNSPENDRMAIQQVLNKVKALRDEVGCAFAFINHENKTAYPNGEAQGEPTMGTMAGSVGIGAAAEFCLTVRKVEDGTSLVWHTKSTLAAKHKSFYASISDVPAGIIIRGLDNL